MFLQANTRSPGEAMNNYMLIRDAILNKQIVKAVYKGHFREMCPHVLGTKNGRRQCLFYQFGGSSSSGGYIQPGSPANWRCIPIYSLEDVEVTDGEWHTAANHSRPQTCVDNIEAEVAY